MEAHHSKGKMMVRNDFAVVSAADGLEIQVVVMMPDSQILGVVQFAHGMAEHKERYFDFMKYLAAAGFVAVIHDHRGHGTSVRSAEDLGFFNDDTGMAVVEDLHQVAVAVQERYSYKPYILFGHSMGSLVARCYAKKYDSYIDRLILCGSPARNPLVPAALCLARQLERIKGSRHRSGLLKSLVLGPYEKAGEKDLPNSWICRNKEVVEEYNTSELCGFNFTVNGYINLFSLLKETYSKKGWALSRPELPILFLAGSQDPVIGGERGWQETKDFMAQVGYTQIQDRLYEGLLHEILNEENRSPIFSDILKWMMS